MARINLLPWRAEERERRNREFMLQLVGVALLSLLGAFLLWSYFGSELSSQREANGLVEQANISLDRDLEEIKELEKTRDDIESRMRVIQDLQGTRPLPVHVLDTLVRAMPAKLYLTRVQREGNLLILQGRADNPNVVSDLLRSLDASEWLSGSVVKNIANSMQVKPAPVVKDGDTVIVTAAPAPEENYITFEMVTNIKAIEPPKDDKAK